MYKFVFVYNMYEKMRESKHNLMAKYKLCKQKLVKCSFLIEIIEDIPCVHIIPCAAAYLKFQSAQVVHISIHTIDRVSNKLFFLLFFCRVDEVENH